MSFQKISEQINKKSNSVMNENNDFDRMLLLYLLCWNFKRVFLF